MRKSYCLEKFENYKTDEGYSLYIRGWYLTKNHEKLIPEIFSSDSLQLARITTINRQDVLNIFQDSDSTVECGFIIEAKLNNQAQDLKLVLNGEPVLDLKGNNFALSVRKTDFLYDFSLHQEDEHNFRVVGFATSISGHDLKISVADSRKRKIEQTFSILKDFKSSFYCDDSVKNSGFEIDFSFSESDFPIYLVMETENESLSIPLSMHFSRRQILINNLVVLGWSKLFPLWKANGTRFLARKLFRQELYTTIDEQSESKWYKENTPTTSELQDQTLTKFEYEPCISLVCAAYQSNLDYLRLLIESLDQQTYQNWELCLADGSIDNSVEQFIKNQYSEHPKINYQRIGKNLGISGNTNEAIKLATGEFIGFIDHDDELRADALFEVVKRINEDECDFIYTDEDKIDNKGKLSDLFFKPDYSPDYLLTRNYINHFSVIRKSVVDQIGLLRSEFDGSQDYDFLLRMIDVVPKDKIAHISKPLYHWRMTGASTALDPESKLWAFEAGKRAIQNYLDRNNIEAIVTDGPYLGTYNVKYQLKEQPMISIIIPNKDHIDELEVLLSSIKTKIRYKNYEILVVENNSTEDKTFNYYESIETRYPKVRLLHWNKVFNYSAINNFAVSKSQGELLLLMNNDMEVISSDLLEGMAANAIRDEVGAVGIKLLYQSGKIQHNGVFWGIEGGYHLFLDDAPEGPSYGHLKLLQHNVSAVTGAALMVTKKKYLEVGGLDERYRVAYNDVDFCFKLIKAGYFNVILPQYSMYHYESLSRGLEDTPEKLQRFYSELDRLTDSWYPFFKHGDPFYNENLSLLRYYTPRLRSEYEHYEKIYSARKKRDQDRLKNGE